MEASIIDGFLFVLQPSHFIFLFIGVAGGIVVGALPGLTGSVGIILLLPFVFYVDPSTAMVMLCGMFCGAIYGGSISAILISTPGTPSAAATLLDGYPMSRKGQAGRAIGVATIASTTGGIISTFCLMFIAPQLASFALKFGPVEYFALMVFGLTVIASVSGKSLVKGLISGVFEPADRRRRHRPHDGHGALLLRYSEFDDRLPAVAGPDRPVRHFTDFRTA